jgi:hypothetical protein
LSSVGMKNSTANAHVNEEESMKNTWITVILLAGICLLFGCGEPERVHTWCPPAHDRQARENYILGEYRGSAFYNDLEIFSNHIFSCTCYITGVYTRVTGKWELKLEKGKERITFYRVFDENGNDTGNSIPLSMQNNGRVTIDIDGYRDISFSRIRSDEEKQRILSWHRPKKPERYLNFLDQPNNAE